MNTNVKLNHLEAQVHVSELNWSAKIPNYSPSAVAYSLSSLFTVYASLLLNLQSIFLSIISSIPLHRSMHQHHHFSRY